ncbi:MAG: hypothetical protein KGL98_00690 [Gammaproteobacteria bacterium]|nr:hypothetical protein [Gammaproteobacteria bacterium]
MPETEYRKDFPHSLAEFDALKAKATIVYALPLPDEATDAKAALSGSGRDACYENVGLHIVNHAQLIVALWNGVPATDRGGTAQIVEYALSESAGAAVSPQFSQNAGSGKAVWHLRIPRLNSHSEPDAETTSHYYTAVWRFSEKRDQKLPFTATDSDWPKLHFAHLRSMEAFNTEALALSPQRIHESLDAILPADVEPKTIDTSERIVHSFVAADLISGKHQNTTYKLWRLIFALACAMILAFESYSHLWPHGLLLLLYPAAFVVMTIAYSVLNRRRLNDRFIDARILAEALRVVIYWRLAGIPESIADQYLGRHITAIGWIPGALSGLLTLPPPDTRFAQKDGLRIADEFWVSRQRKYYERQSARQGRRVQFYRRFAGSLYALTLVFSVCVAIYGVVVTKASLLRDLLILLMASGPAVAVLWIAYAEKQGWERHVQEYTRNAALFAGAHELIAKRSDSDLPANFASIQKVLLELGREAIWENAEWAVLHRVKPPAIPLG